MIWWVCWKYLKRKLIFLFFEFPEISAKPENSHEPKIVWETVLP